MEPLFSLVPLETYPTIRIPVEALRTHPRGSQSVLEVRSLFILKQMSSLVPYPYILWTTLASRVCKWLPQRPGSLPTLTLQPAWRDARSPPRTAECRSWFSSPPSPPSPRIGGTLFGPHHRHVRRSTHVRPHPKSRTHLPRVVTVVTEVSVPEAGITRAAGAAELKR
jgi:hypothetical protein